MARRTTSPTSRRSKAKTIDAPTLAIDIPSAAETKPETFDPYWQQLEHESNTATHPHSDQIATADVSSNHEPDAQQLSGPEGADRATDCSGSADSNGKGLSQKSKRQARSQKPAFKVGDRVRVTKGAAKGLISHITAIEPDLKHSCTLHVGGRQRPDYLEKLEAEPEPAQAVGESVTLTVPPSPQVSVEVGDTIHTSSGAATVTHTEQAGNETIVHADYGSGIEQPHVSEGIQSTPQLNELAAQFNQLEQDADQARQTQISAGRAHWEARRDQGAILLQAKSQVAHGGWQSWVEENCKTADGKPLGIRTAQIYMQVATHWDEICKNEMHFAFGLEAGLRQLRKVLKPQRQLTLDVSPTEQPEQSDTPIPPLDELKRLYEPIGTVKDWGSGFCVERPDLGNPFPLAFKTPALAWAYWQRSGEKLLELAKRKPKIEAVVEVSQTLEPPPQKEQVPVEQIEQVTPYGWIQTKDGQNLNPDYYEPSSALAQPEPATETDLDTLFEAAMAEALEPVQEWLGKAMQKHLDAAQNAIGQLGALPVGLRAAYEADRDDLIRLREFINLMLEVL
jgi:hypothetical protein